MEDSKEKVLWTCSKPRWHIRVRQHNRDALDSPYSVRVDCGYVLRLNPQEAVPKGFGQVWYSREMPALVFHFFVADFCDAHQMILDRTSDRDRIPEFPAANQVAMAKNGCYELHLYECRVEGRHHYMIALYDQGHFDCPTFFLMDHEIGAFTRDLQDAYMTLPGRAFHPPGET